MGCLPERNVYRNTPYLEGRKYIEGLEGEEIAGWLYKYSEDRWTELFKDYSGENSQRIETHEGDYESPAVCSDVFFYKAIQGEQPEEAVKQMIDMIMQPLMLSSDTRPFKVTDYKIIEQELLPVEKNIWVIPHLNVYYSYEGTDHVTKEEYMESAPELAKEGLMPLMTEGSADPFAFILLEKDGVYRLQRAEKMISMYYK